MFSPRTLAAILSLLILLAPFSSCFEDSGAPMDEGLILVYPELVQHGAVPYRDFETIYGPANPWLLSVIYSTFGTTISVERATGLLYRILILLALFLIAQRWGPIIAAGCTLIAGCLLVTTGIVAYAWMGAMACALWYVWMITSCARSFSRCLGAGLIAGLALLFRVDAGPAIILVTVGETWRCLRLRCSRRELRTRPTNVSIFPISSLSHFSQSECCRSLW